MSAKQKSNSGKSAPPSRGFDAELAALEALKFAPIDSAAIDHLRKALAHRNNYVVSKAAKLVADNEIAALLPQVLAAYERFFEDAEKSDPQCWAKNALVKTLVKLEHRDKDAYLRGLRHHQMEPVWGGVTDTAGTLRGECAHALVNCVGISDQELLTLLIDLFADKDKAVRVEAARAIGNVGGTGAPLLLRLRATLGSDEPEVLGACYSALLSLEGARAIPFIAQFLAEGDELSGEAAFALAETQEPEALKALIARRAASTRSASSRSSSSRVAPSDDWFDSILLSAIALCRLPDAINYLLEIVARDERASAPAIEAIARTAPNDEIRARLLRAVESAGSPRLEKALREHLSTT